MWGGVGVCNTDCVTCDPVCGVGWGGVWCATHTVKCGPVCGVGVGWGLQHILCYMWSCLWGWGGVWFATMTVRSGRVCGVGMGWGLQHRPCYVLDPSGYFSLLPVHNDLINKDCGMCHPV